MSSASPSPSRRRSRGRWSVGETFCTNCGREVNEHVEVVDDGSYVLICPTAIFEPVPPASAVPNEATTEE